MRPPDAPGLDRQRPGEVTEVGLHLISGSGTLGRLGRGETRETGVSGGRVARLASSLSVSGWGRSGNTRVRMRGSSADTRGRVSVVTRVSRASLLLGGSRETPGDTGEQRLEIEQEGRDTETEEGEGRKVKRGGGLGSSFRF